MVMYVNYGTAVVLLHPTPSCFRKKNKMFRSLVHTVPGRIRSYVPLEGPTPVGINILFNPIPRDIKKFVVLFASSAYYLSIGRSTVELHKNSQRQILGEVLGRINRDCPRNGEGREGTDFEQIRYPVLLARFLDFRISGS